MEDTKFVKARCKKTGKFFALEVKKFGLNWRVVNVDELSADKARLIVSEVKQGKFNANDNLLPCSVCGSRRIAGCDCARKKYNYCSPHMEYHLDCAYCDELELLYTRASTRYTGEVVIVQGKAIRAVNFSNAEWVKFDNIQHHENGRLRGFLSEPHVHVKAREEDIEFHGYNVSEMDEGVYYEIGANDDFSIECNVNTSGIKPHPGGHLYIKFGLIEAQISENGGSFFLGGQHCCNVGSNFKMLLSLTNSGKYTIVINGRTFGVKTNPSQSSTRITFGFKHGAHFCHLLSHAKLSNIKMTQGIPQQE